MGNIKSLQQKLNRIEKELEKVRGCSPLTHGWQTQRYAKASRKWDKLSEEKEKVLMEIENEHFDDKPDRIDSLLWCKNKK